MNPFLEQERVWHDFHERFIPAAAEALGEQVDPKYIVKIDEHVYIHELEAESRAFLGRGDLTVTRAPNAGESKATAAVLEAPAQVRLPHLDTERVSYLEIRDRESWQVVTVLELLSPANKRPGPDRETYIAKRSELLNSPVHFIELDLLRGGPRLPLLGLQSCDYYALVSRVEERPRAGVWPLSLRDRLPVLPIPLRSPDPDAALDLQSILHRVYDAARYQRYIYTMPPQPPLPPAEAAWAAELSTTA
jgi:hypothetical protein